MAATTDVKVPDIGDFADVPVIEVYVSAGDLVNEEDPLITVESDKATMDIPAPSPGTVAEVLVKVGDRVSEGTAIVVLTPGDGALAPPPSLVDQQEPEPEPEPEPVSASSPAGAPPTNRAPSAAPSPAAAAGASPALPEAAGSEGAHAGPGVRRLAHELDIDLTTLAGTGPKGRIVKEDLLAAVAGRSAPPPAAAGAAIPEIPAQDFSKFGPVEIRPLSRIKKLSGPHLLRSWLNIPHVTHNDEADIGDLDGYRRELDEAAKADGYRVTLLAFLLKASVAALKAFPELNASLSPTKDSLILKGYYHLGVAVDTPDGLVVPVIRDVDRKGVEQLSRELASVSAKAREGKLGLEDISGGTFTISSLGGIGGTSFSPIINAPEVAILGVVRSRMAPVWDGEAFVPHLLLPLSLSYDHRVVDGALAARFCRRLCHVLEDVRRLVL